MQTVYARGGGGGGSQQREVADGADAVFTDTRFNVYNYSAQKSFHIAHRASFCKMAMKSCNVCSRHVQHKLFILQ